MSIVFIIILIIASLLALSKIIISKQPNSAEVFNKIIPYQGIIGIVLFVWGIIDFFSNIKWWAGCSEQVLSIVSFLS